MSAEVTTKTHKRYRTIRNIEAPTMKSVLASMSDDLVKFFVPAKRFSNLDESALLDLVTINQTDLLLRQSLWAEYVRAKDKNVLMSMRGIFGTICSEEYFLDLSSEKKAFLLIPPKNYLGMMEVALERGMARLIEIMNLPLVDGRGAVNSKVMDGILKAFQMVDKRVMGDYTQRIEQNTTIEDNTKTTKLADIEAELLELEKQEKEVLEIEQRLASPVPLPKDILLTPQVEPFGLDKAGVYKSKRDEERLKEIVLGNESGEDFSV
jgi:hypothetical protein